MAPAKRPVPDGYHTVTPVLTFENCSAALDWYGKALGAVELTRTLGPDGKIMHAAFRIGDSHLMAHDTMMGGNGPIGLRRTPAAISVYVENCYAVYQHDICGGATEVM